MEEGGDPLASVCSPYASGQYMADPTHTASNQPAHHGNSLGRPSPGQSLSVLTPPPPPTPPPPTPPPRRSPQVHKQLQLSVLRCEDVADSSTAFRILHPLKSFLVTAESPQAKTQWVRVLSQTANSARPKPRALDLEAGSGDEATLNEEEDLELRASTMIEERDEKSSHERRASVNL